MSIVGRVGVVVLVLIGTNVLVRTPAELLLGKGWLPSLFSLGVAVAACVVLDRVTHHRSDPVPGHPLQNGQTIKVSLLDPMNGVGTTSPDAWLDTIGERASPECFEEWIVGREVSAEQAGIAIEKRQGQVHAIAVYKDGNRELYLCDRTTWLDARAQMRAA